MWVMRSGIMAKCTDDVDHIFTVQRNQAMHRPHELHLSLPSIGQLIPMHLLPATWQLQS